MIQRPKRSKPPHTIDLLESAIIEKWAKQQLPLIEAAERRGEKYIVIPPEQREMFDRFLRLTIKLLENEPRSDEQEVAVPKRSSSRRATSRRRR